MPQSSSQPQGSAPDSQPVAITLDCSENRFPEGKESESNAELSKGRTNFFIPKLLPNGALLIRNDHRVLAIDDSPSLRLQVSNTKLHVELAKLLQNIDPQANNDDAVVNFSIIHRQPDGSFVQTRTLPKQLSDWGQTLVFIGNDLDLSASDLLSDADISTVWEESRTGTAILRVFADFTLVYGDYRANDEFDTTIDSYDVHSFDTLDEPKAVKVSQDLDYVQSWVESRTEDRLEESELESSESESETENQVEAITSLTPFFHELPNQPVHYSDAHDRYWTLSEQFRHNLAVVEVPLEAFNDIDDFEHNFCETVETHVLGKVDLPAHQTLLLTENIDGHQAKECIHALDTEAAKAWIKARANEMRQQFSQAMEDDPDSDESDLLNDILFGGYVRVHVALVFDAKPDYVQLNRLMKQLSGQVDAGGNLSVPYVGFYQGYDCGGYDTGNAPMLLTPQEIEDEDEDEDEDYEDEE